MKGAAASREGSSHLEGADRLFDTAHRKASLTSDTVRGGAVSLVAQGAKIVISLGTTAVLGRLLTPEDYGLVGMVVVFTGFIALFQHMGLSTATLQREHITHAQVSTLFWVNVAAGSTAMLVTVVAAPIIARSYGDPRLIGIALGLSGCFLFGGLTPQHAALLRRQMRFATLVTIEVTSLLVGVTTAMILAWNKVGYWALIVNQLVQSATYTLGVWMTCRWRPGAPARLRDVGSMLAFGGNITGFSVLSYFANKLDSFLIGLLWGARPLSLYAKARELAFLPATQTSAALHHVAVAALSPLARSPDLYRRAYLRVLEKVAVITVPGAAWMVGTSDWIVEILLGSQWGETGHLLALMSIAGMLDPVANTCGWHLLASGRGHHLLQWGALSAVVVIVSVLVGLPWGARGVAASYAIGACLVYTPLYVWWACRVGPVRSVDFYRTVAPAVLAAIVVLLVLFQFRRWAAFLHPFYGLVASLAIAVATTAISLASLPRGRAAMRDLIVAARLLSISNRSTPPMKTSANPPSSGS